MSERAWTETLRELDRLRGPGMQVAQYLALLAGVRSSIDDWVPTPQFEHYRHLVADLGLALEIDCVFKPLPASQQAFGLEYAPTTRAAGKPYSAADASDPGDSVHVAIARSRQQAQETAALAWYPLVVDNRVTYKPRIDFRRLGAAFGYPKCCVDFFMEHNDWPRQNNLAESAKASRSFSWKANCIIKNTSLMLIFHMPCAFDCQPTLNYTEGVLAEMRKFDPRLVARIESFAKQTFLVVSERLSFTLSGARQQGDGRVAYRSADSLHRHLSLKDPQHEDYCRALESGNELAIWDGIIFIWKDGRLQETIETRCDEGVAEVPILLDFN